MQFMDVVGRCVCPQFSADPSADGGDCARTESVTLASPVGLGDVPAQQSCEENFFA